MPCCCCAGHADLPDKQTSCRSNAVAGSTPPTMSFNPLNVTREPTISFTPGNSSQEQRLGYKKQGQHVTLLWDPGSHTLSLIALSQFPHLQSQMVDETDFQFFFFFKSWLFVPKKSSVDAAHQTGEDMGLCGVSWEAWDSNHGAPFPIPAQHCTAWWNRAHSALQ